MKYFYIAETPSAHGHKEIHHQDCPIIPDMLNRKYLGPYNNSAEALRRALTSEPRAVCCPVCCKSVSEKVLLF
ncbi:hypothetical protein [Anditalea andensis]|uniref:Uncharacterized protein n=1 Tax=Anditalea andensis TaxID=1048983 RepID=A0A074KU48_9BACT|nr:hypothetical protein [Anditalea andensis]KEO72444.1 hypothetical protein EL17_17025 [Anditalea andensis]